MLSSVFRLKRLKPLNVCLCMSFIQAFLKIRGVLTSTDSQDLQNHPKKGSQDVGTLQLFTCFSSLVLNSSKGLDCLATVIEEPRILVTAAVSRLNMTLSAKP